MSLFPSSALVRSLSSLIIVAAQLSALVLASIAPSVALQAQSNYATPYAFTTLAGYATRGSADGTGTLARFYDPQSVAADAAGNLYVADSHNSTIRKITPAGLVTTFAGTAGFSGTTDSADGVAQFNYPRGVAVDAGGNVFVGDGSCTIRKVTPVGLVTTLAGLPYSSGSADGTGSAARFSYFSALAVDGAGNVYVADSYNHTIRKVTSGGVVTTIAGTAGNSGAVNGPVGAALFNNPKGLAFDGTGNLYVADYNNHVIRKISTLGIVTTFAGSAGDIGSVDGTGTTARFGYPTGIASDGLGNFYVSEAGNGGTIRKITAAGVVSTLAGNATQVGSFDGTGSAARFNYPASLAVGAAGDIYVADINNATVRRVTTAGVVTTFAGSPALGSVDGTGSTARFSEPRGVAVDQAGNVYVSDTGNNTIRKITATGVVTTLAGSAGLIGTTDGTGSAARFRSVKGLVLDVAGNVYVADGDLVIRKITPAGVTTTVAGNYDISGSIDGIGTAARFNGAQGLAADGLGNLYVADTSNHTIRKITPAGVVTTLAGSAGISGYTDATGSAARFYYPFDVAADAAGNVFVADTFNFIIRKISPAGVVTTLAGFAGNNGYSDGVGSAASFNTLVDITVDDQDNVYVAEQGTGLIRKITPAGVATTLAGNTFGYYGSSDGVGSGAQFNGPVDIAVDSTGKIYVADTGNNTIRLGVLAPPILLSSATGNGTVGVNFGYPSTFSGSPTSYSASGLPAGVSIAPATGIISGIPTAAGTFLVNLGATNAGGTSVTPLTLEIARGTATISVDHLVTTYNGSAHAGNAATIPASLNVVFSYNGSTITPANAGTYYVVGEINDANYLPASASGSLVIAKASATLALGGLAATYDSSPHAATAITTPAGVNVSFTYNGSGATPTNAGAYSVIGTLNDANYLPASVSGTLNISKASATVVFGNLVATYNILPHAATAITTPAGLAVSFTYDGSAAMPINAGTYAVVGTLNDANYLPVTIAGSLVIAKVTPVITWPVPSAVNPGTALSATQLNATSSVPGSFRYSPASGVLLAGGFQTLTTAFTPTDTVNFSSTTAQQTLTVNIGPSITTQPLSHPAFVGGSVSFICVVSGAPIPTYQWQKGGINIPGANASTLTLPNVQLSDAGSYALVATNVAGAVTSRFARLVVLSPQQNAITYATTKSSTGVTAGGMVNFDYFVTNVGTKAWGAHHYLSIRDVNNAFVAFSSLIGILPGETTTANLNFPAPTTPGTYTYYVQGLEDGVEFFSTQTTVMLTVLAPVANAITYNTTTFPVSAAPAANVIFTYNVTNTGTATWGAGHFLTLKNNAGTTLSTTPLTVLAPGASKTVNLSFTAPTIPGAYTYTVQASQAGVGNFGTQANLTLVVLAPQPNAIVYNRVRYPDEVVPGAVLNLKYTLSNAGTQSWGAGHYVSLRDSADNYLAFIPLSSTAVGGSKTVEFTLTAPMAPDTYTYYVQALEDGIEFFSTQDVVIIKVLTLPLGNAIAYNTSTIPVTASPGATVNFTVNVTNRGTRTWGTTHYLSFRDVDNTFLAFPTLNGVAPGASRTSNLSFIAPATPGIYTYTLQAFEDGVSFFEMADTVVLLVQ